VLYDVLVNFQPCKIFHSIPNQCKSPEWSGSFADDSDSTDLKPAAMVQALSAPSEADEVVFELIGKFHMLFKLMEQLTFAFVMLLHVLWHTILKSSKALNGWRVLVQNSHP
jgi:hypothetical protein